MQTKMLIGNAFEAGTETVIAEVIQFGLEIDDAVLSALDGFSIHDPETLRITRETLLHDALRARLDLPALELRFEGA